MRTRVVRALCASALLLSTALASTGCRGTSTSAAPPPASTAPATAEASSLPDISGNYVLETINGSPLPYTMTHEPPGVRVLSGSLRIDADGTCAGRTEFVPPSGETMTREVKAQWTREGATLRLSWEGAGITTGTVSGDTFTMENEGQVLVYRKER